MTILPGDASVVGHIYAINEDPRFQPARLPLLNVVVNLLAMDSEEVVASTRTDSTGAYQFEDLSSGTYSVTRVQPGCILDGGAGELAVDVGASEVGADNDLSEKWLRPEYISCGMFLASTVKAPCWGWDVGLGDKITDTTPSEDVALKEETGLANAASEVVEVASAIPEDTVPAVSGDIEAKLATEDLAVDDLPSIEQPWVAMVSAAVSSARLEAAQASEPVVVDAPVQEVHAEIANEISATSSFAESGAVTSAVSEPELSPVACVNQPDSPAMQESRHEEIPAGDSSVGKEFANEEDLGETVSSFGNSIQLVQTECSLPDDLEVSVRFHSEPNTASRWANALVVFDYRSESDYKFAGAFTGTNQWAIGRMTERGYVIEIQLCEEIDAETGLEMQIALEGDRVTVIADGELKVSHSFDDVSNQRPLGLSSYLATNRFKGFSVTGLSADEDLSIDAELPG